MASQQFYEVDMQIDDLAKFLFKENVNNVTIELSLGGIADNKDLFFFCLDLFCKGLVMLYGQGSKSVSIENITQEQFNQLQSKMICAGVKANLSIFPLDIDVDIQVSTEEEGNETVKSVSVLNIDELNDAPNDKPLPEYEFKLINHDVMYVVNFNLVHTV
jgi:hypothetical protein